ncbi:hypothetical protein [Streptomyces sp. NPDC059168]|uniref:hypothetical protein n=1 Tax=Streptomyces sp. NPDC059168 TaxID=3346753 RepID=UPI0036C886C5
MAAGGAGAWWWTRSDEASGPVSCSTLLADARIQDALGSSFRTSMSCSELGEAMKKAAVGDEAGVHTETQAQAMRDILQSTDDALTTSGQKSIESSLRLPLAQLIADYTPDTYEIFKALDADYVKHASDDKPWSDSSGVHMAVWDDTLIRVTRAVADNPDAYAYVRDAQTRHAARVLIDIPRSADGVTLATPAAGNASALGALDAVAQDVTKDASSQAATEWTKDVVTALKRSAPAPVPHYGADPVGYIRGTWAAQLSPAAAGVVPKDFTEQGVQLLDLWAKGRADGFKPSENLRKDCRNSQSERYGDTLDTLKKASAGKLALGPSVPGPAGVATPGSA